MIKDELYNIRTYLKRLCHCFEVLKVKFTSALICICRGENYVALTVIVIVRL